MTDSYPQIREMGVPDAVYLARLSAGHDTEAELYNGKEVLSLRSARRARWTAPPPYREVHWWRLTDESYRIGYHFGNFVWLGFEGVATERGFEGVFRFWSHSGPALKWDSDINQVEARLEEVACEGPRESLVIHR